MGPAGATSSTLDRRLIDSLDHLLRALGRAFSSSVKNPVVPYNGLIVVKGLL